MYLGVIIMKVYSTLHMSSRLGLKIVEVECNQLFKWIRVRILRVLLIILFPPQIQHKTLQSRKRNGIEHNEH